MGAHLHWIPLGCRKLSPLIQSWEGIVHENSCDHKHDPLAVTAQDPKLEPQQEKENTLSNRAAKSLS